MDGKLKHLEFLQNIIARMNANSFSLKGWCVTLVAAIFALAANDADIRFIAIALVPTFIFWILDGYYLGQERQYRGLYAAVARTDPNQIDYSLNAVPYCTGRNTWLRAMFSKTILIFYGSILAATGLFWLWQK